MAKLAITTSSKKSQNNNSLTVNELVTFLTVNAITTLVNFMASVSNEELIKRAKAVAKKHVIVNKASTIKTGEVGSALVTDKGNLYVGVSIDASCGIGFCAESSAIAAMVTAGEHSIKKIVAITGDGTILPPCGRCREIIYQINGNANVDVIIAKNRIVKLKKLLPEIWQERFDKR